MSRNRPPGLAEGVVMLLGQQLRLVEMLSRAATEVLRTAADSASRNADAELKRPGAEQNMDLDGESAGPDALLNLVLLPLRGLGAALETRKSTSASKKAPPLHPVRIELVERPGTPTKGQFLLENRYDHKVSVSLAISKLRSVAKGKVQKVLPTLSMQSLDIEPGERRALTVSVPLEMQELAPGEYQASVRIVGLDVDPIQVLLRVPAKT